ncbi:DUF4365 domain-containing protein [Enterobacter hormaechei subsp. xiangfangensis]|uniref:DUF4365 domain-containing protein n=1 Tax=Enterobacter TaxID=547 RepID=UPI000F844F0D|nr:MULTISPECIES: DUF4365 domain-containing protein [Enterobacter]MCE1275510.1 DUF4365 domain-containing protein [Enterobacter hormaechei]MCE1312020.1 DUF4365 domain-containing protein [Enterobacter hormaechei]MDZ5638106.1 DUF4365 domain-containing protein [Enterobacter sp. A103]RTN15742.1 DUF4365 domain-containing protein [Enterobacter hormaechei]
MTSESNRIGSIGVNFITSIFTKWGWGFQPISQENDDGFDGLLYIRTKKTDPAEPNNKSKQSWNFTGGVIHVQIKTGSSFITKKDKDIIKIKINKLEQKKEIWQISPIPCILIHVNLDDDDEPSHTYWADLKLQDTYNPKESSVITIPVKNRLAKSKECQGPLRRLAKVSKNYAEKPVLDFRNNDSLKGVIPATLPGNLNDSLKYRAIKFYQQWKNAGAKNPYFGDILINRTGWSHITRKGRPITRIEASFGLLPIAARIINEVSRWRMLTPTRVYDNRKDGYTSIIDFVGLTAKIILKHRTSTEVMVVLKREVKFKTSEGNATAKTRLWFYTVYEPGRGK